MPLQYNEYYNEQTGLTIGLKRLLFSEQSPYQRVEVYETDTWGNLMTIDGMVMLSERDEFVYHEMLSHVAMFTHPNPEKVLIIGGGDGGTAREVLKHPSVQDVDLVEIDETVVRASKAFLPNVGNFDHPNLELHFEDGIQFVQSSENKYDVIIIDGSDPVGPAEGLFEKEFYQFCFNALRSDGVLTSQTESPWVASYHPSIKKVFHALDDLFPNSHMFLSFIPLYPAGMWSMACASKSASPLDEQVIERVQAGVSQIEPLRYYNPDIHKAAFALPVFVSDLIKR
ncbi:MAG: polyamine aminopropyltransferase [Balneolaceae bacterium]